MTLCYFVLRPLKIRGLLPFRVGGDNQKYNDHITMEKENFIYGLHPVTEAIKSGKEIDRILFKKGCRVLFPRNYYN